MTNMKRTSTEGKVWNFTKNKDKNKVEAILKKKEDKVTIKTFIILFEIK